MLIVAGCQDLAVSMHQAGVDLYGKYIFIFLDKLALHMDLEVNIQTIMYTILYIWKINFQEI